MGYVFISYSHADSAFVTFLASSLRQRGIEYWLDIEHSNIPPGTVWDKCVHEALKHAERLLLVISPKSMASDEVGAEWKYALECHIPIVPVYYQPCEIWYRLRPIQYVDFRKDYNSGIELLIKVLAELVPSGRVPCDKPTSDDPTPHIERLQHESWHVRLDAVDTLLKMAAGAGLLALIQALTDAHPCVCEQAAHGLAELQYEGPFRKRWPMPIGTGAFSQTTTCDGRAPFSEDWLRNNTHLNIQKLQFKNRYIADKETWDIPCMVSIYDVNKLWFSAYHCAAGQFQLDGVSLVVNSEAKGEITFLPPPFVLRKVEPALLISVVLDCAIRVGDKICIFGLRNNNCMIVIGPDLYYHFDSFNYRHDYPHRPPIELYK